MHAEYNLFKHIILLKKINLKERKYISVGLTIIIFFVDEQLTSVDKIFVLNEICKSLREKFLNSLLLLLCKHCNRSNYFLTELIFVCENILFVLTFNSGLKFSEIFMAGN
ncbi:MAG: hypothetical protein DAHOPDDO_03454 [Ignavibacteriaceae bacterium]|nr:hypothetical protein [Ignavibacteriaceae bacterium]